MYRKPFKPKPVKKNCVFCKSDSEPDYKSVEQLRMYVSERGKILGRARTGICAKHQRDLSREIKRARHIATLPFVAGL
ncbi:MAG: 30S ribosomal protein S18 [Microgenomates group bacterium GW2011_GWA1_48_10]|nr:MAG: 30S ribosomal protein S18 [Microgenomates group bacterium GW2011_GWA1_48_10]